PEPVGAACQPPAPEPEPEPPPPLPPESLPPVPAIRPAELTEPAPAPEPMRYDLFQTRQVKPVEGEAQGTKPVRLEPIEKPGVLLRRVDMQMTSDLSPVPKVVPAEELYVRQTPVPEEDIPEGQQRFANFDKEAADSVDEAALHARLEKNKLERTAQFQTLRTLGAQLEKGGETGEQPPPPEEQTNAPEYRRPNQRDSVFQLLQRLRGRRGSTALALGIFALLAVGAQLIAIIGDDFMMGAGHLTAMALFLVAGILASGSDLIGGFKALLRRKPNADTLLLFAALACAAQQVLLFVFMGDVRGESVPAGESNPYKVAACVPLFLFIAAVNAAARWQQARQRCDNFRFCAYTAADGLYAVASLDAREAVKTPRQNALPGRARTVLPVPVAFPAGFLRQSAKEDAVDRSGGKLLPLGLGLAGLAALCAFLLQGKAVAVVSAAAAAMCLCVPCGSLFILANLIRGLTLTKSARENGVAILNTEAAEECSRAGAYMLDSADLYLPAKGRMHGWREFRQVRADEVLLYAAGIAIAAGGPLRAVFEGVVEGDYAVLPDIRDLTFEDRMGLSCWIHNQKVFFGNRSLLENHGVTVALSDKDERAYEHDGRRIIYLAVEKRLSAFFVVSYTPDAAMAPAIRQLEREDTQALICNSDPCVGAEVLSEAFGLRKGSLSLLRAAPSQACRKQMRTPREHISAGVYHANNARAFLRALSACVSLRGGIRRLRLVQMIASITTVVFLLMFVLMGQMHVADSLIFIALELVWAAVMHSVTRS
ncbi:MAG: hypothetical protein FWC27_02125, partial [Firmicutes bacterium]|nr:hypothetical protein [Bacillota bacterium]